MAADMSKKPALGLDNRQPTATKTSRRTILMQQQAKADRLYNSVLDCLQSTRQSRGATGIYAGLPIALAAQVPYTVVLMSSFELSNRLIEDKSVKFNRYDDYLFIYKFLQRFGASTIAVTLATALCYPLDTLKRMYQLEGSIGHAARPGSAVSMPRYMMLSDQRMDRGFYRGFSVAMAKAVPLAFVQFLCFQNLRALTTQQ